MFFNTPQLDLSLLIFINQHGHSALLNLPMVLLSSKAALFPLLAAIAAWSIWKHGKKRTALFLLLLLAMGLSDLTTNVVKGQVQRVRPLNAVASTWYVEDGEWRRRSENFVRTKAKGSSYPSAHAANTACLAVLGMLLFPAKGNEGLGKKALWLPLLVGFSRVYLGKHYPTDVVAGWLFGAVVAGFVWLAWRLWLREFLARRWPGWAE